MKGWELDESFGVIADWLAYSPTTERERQTQQQQRRKQRWATWGIPAISIELITSGGIRDTPATEALASSRGPLRILSAIVDHGKTVAAAWWLANTTEQAPNFLRTAQPLFLPIRAFARKSWFDSDASERIERARALVLDDLGDESLDRAGGLRAQVDALIDARYANLLPTVITTNLSAVAFARRYGARALRRIHERGEYIELSAKTASSANHGPRGHE